MDTFILSTAGLIFVTATAFSTVVGVVTIYRAVRFYWSTKYTNRRSKVFTYADGYRMGRVLKGKL